MQKQPLLIHRYEHAQWASVWSITTCGRSLSVTSTLFSRLPGWAARSTACNQGACECCWDTSLLDKRCNQKARHIKSKNRHRISSLSPCGALHCSQLLPSVHLHLNYGQQIHSNLFMNVSCTPQWNLNGNSLDYRNPANVHVQVIRVGLYREQFSSVKVLHKETALKQVGIPAFRNVSGSTFKLCHIKHALQSSWK